MQIRKIKPLRPSMREKKRYLVVEAADSTLKKINASETKRAIIKSHKRLFGIYGLASAGIMFIENRGGRMLVRVNNKELDKLRTSIAFITSTGQESEEGKKVILKSVGVSGTLKKAREKYIQSK